MVGLLTALPGTQFTRRLGREGRLLPFANEDAGDQCTAGLNFVPLRPRRAVLEDYRAVLRAIYDPAAYFERVRIVGRRLRRPSHQVTPVARVVMRDLMTLLRQQVVIQMALYLHLGPFSNFVVQELDRQIGAIEEESSVLERV
jgi:hypothetical protein